MAEAATTLTRKWRRSTLSTANDLAKRKIVLLFYKEFEQDKFLKYDRYLKRLLRPFYNLLHHRQKKTGFAVSFELLQRALRQGGWKVHINDYRLARQHPAYPVGLVGFPLLLDDWDLPNPALLGPSLFDHPNLNPRLMEDPRFRAYLVLAQWTYDMFHPVYGDACTRWHAGIDTEEWPDLSSHEKDIDFLIYDKIRWDHGKFQIELIDPVRVAIERRGLRTATVRYKFHDHQSYRRLLQRSRALVFLCEHETQGIAYQEALASNVPVLAWDNGYWLDPLWRRVSDRMVPASSVPFFTPACGERFSDLAHFEAALSRFLERLPSMTPRRYVIENLSMEKSANIYAAAYFGLLRLEGKMAHPKDADRSVVF
ncbi:MAG: glycosyltransferase [Acidobacteriaceae bacterium]|nr:glycosyltransferase [Acidobacteriaceae bacterium]MBV9754872.1 glycosyltransferase [Hyphomicrobiales bacterium]